MYPDNNVKNLGYTITRTNEEIILHLPNTNDTMHLLYTLTFLTGLNENTAPKFTASLGKLNVSELKEFAHNLYSAIDALKRY